MALSVSQGHRALSQTGTSSACLGSTVTWFLSPEAEPEAPGTEVTQGYGGCQGFPPPRAAGLLTQFLGPVSIEPLRRARQALRIVLSGCFQGCGGVGCDPHFRESRFKSP